MAGVLMGSLKIFSQWFSAERFATVSGLLVGIGALGRWWRHRHWHGSMPRLAGALSLSSVPLLRQWWLRRLCCGRAIRRPMCVEWTGGQATTGSLSLVFGDSRFWHMAPLAFFLAGVAMGFQGLWAGPYLFDVSGLDELQAGNVLLWMAMGLAAGFVCHGGWRTRFGIARITVQCSLLFLCSQFALAARA